MNCLNRIQELLKERNWSMYTLSQRAGIPQSTLSNLFLRCNSPTIPTLERICGAFGITLEEFFHEESEKVSVPPEPLTSEEKKLLDRWRHLDGETRRQLFCIIEKLTPPEV